MDNLCITHFAIEKVPSKHRARALLLNRATLNVDEQNGLNGSSTSLHRLSTGYPQKKQVVEPLATS